MARRLPAARSNVRVELTVGPFYAAIRQAAIVTSEERRGVDFTFGEGKVVLAAHGAEYGDRTSNCPSPTTAPKRSSRSIPAT